jgi:hypothetical protein
VGERASSNAWGRPTGPAHRTFGQGSREAMAGCSRPSDRWNSGACHGRGETGRYRNGFPYPRRNSSGVSRRRGLGRAGARGASGACFVCGQLGHRAAQCARRVLPPETAAAVVTPEVGGVESVDAEEFRAFQEGRFAAQAVEGRDEWEHGACALGAAVLPTQVGKKRNMLAAVGTGGQVVAKEGPVGWQDA